MQEGDRWKDTYHRDGELEGTFSFEHTKQDWGVDEKRHVKGTFSDELVTDVRVTDVTGKKFTVEMKILRLKVNVKMPPVVIQYDSRSDTSGIYHQIFRPLIGESIIMEFNRRGVRTDSKGLRKLLKASRENLPEMGGGAILNKIVFTLTQYLRQRSFISMLTQGWLPLPKKVRSGRRWRVEGWFPFFKIFHVLHGGKVESPIYFEPDTLRKDQLRLKVFPKINILNWNTTEAETEEESAGGIHLTTKDGVKQYRIDIELGGAGKNRASLEIQFDREPAKSEK